VGDMISKRLSMPGSRLWSSPARNYAAALGLVALSVAVRSALDPLLGPRYPYVVQFLAVLACARYLGFGPAVAAMAAATLPSLFTGVTAGNPVEYWVGLPVILGFVLLMVWLVSGRGRLRSEAESSAQLARDRLEALSAEKTQRELEERYSAQLRAIVESSEDAILSKDLEGTIESWNHGAAQIFGYTADEAIGKSIALLVPPERSDEESEIIERIRRGGRVTHFETVRVHKDGRRIDVSLTISPIRNGKGEVVGVSHVARDISEQKKLEAQMHQAQKLESLGVLAGGLAHDFNNLLTGVLGNASLAMEEVGADHPARPRLEEILASGERAAVLVRQMLAYAGKGGFAVERVDLSRQISESVPLIRASLAPGVPLLLELDPNLPAVEADPAQIRQMILNLAINAAEAVGQGSGSVRLATGSRESGGELQVVLQVKDTGCGMDDATKARIFDPFFSTKFTGRGLGLPAVLGIIRAHRGTISVESAPGRGSTFTVVLPAVESLEPTGQREPQELVRGYGWILVVDGEDLVRDMARVTLQRAGYTVETAADVPSAVEVFTRRSQEFDAVLLDLSLPAVNGDEALGALRRIRANVRVVGCSAHSEAEAAQMFAGLGMAGFLQKPYTQTTLTRKLKQTLREGRRSG